MIRSILSLAVIFVTIGGALLSPDDRAKANDSLLIEWEGPSYQLMTISGDDGQTYIRVEAAGYLNGGPPGWPNLPSRGELIALPPSGDYGLELVEIVYEDVHLDYPIEPAPAPIPAPFERDASGEPLPGDWIVAPDDAVYASPTPFPTQPATLGDAVWMRDHRLARLTFTPFRYYPTQGKLEVVRRLRLRVWWEPPWASVSSTPTDGVFDDLLLQHVLNSSDLAGFRASDRTHVLRNEDAGPVQPRVSASQNAPGSYKVLVATEGVYALDYATLLAAGLPLGGIDPSTLRLTHNGGEIAAQWEGDSDTNFEDTERLVFYALPQLTRYAGYDVYWLDWGGDAGQRMASRAGAPATLPAATARNTTYVEENVEYDWAVAGRDGDRWFWKRLKLPDLISDTLEITLATPAAGVEAELTVWFRGYTSTDPNPDHHVRFGMNGTDVGGAQWEGAIVYTATIDLPAGLLQPGVNTVGLSLPGDTGSPVEGTWVDAVAITYGLEAANGDPARFRGQSTASAYTVAGFTGAPIRIYDVTAPDAPRVVTGFAHNDDRVSVGDDGPTPAEYLVLTDDQIMPPQAVVPAKTIDDPPNGADYIIISHPDFLTPLADLADYRTLQGLRVVTADVEAIYDQFGDGRMDPEAIRSYLALAYANWAGPAPQYTVLVGDGTYDPRGYQPDSNPTFLPPYLADVDPEWSETASDNRYADLTGDLLPELRLGRFPANTPADVEAIVDKIIQYETKAPSGGWNRRLVFGADNPSSAGNHHAYADAQFLTYATPAYGHLGTRVYLSATPGAPHWFTTAAAAQDALIGALNRGALFYTYFGHASWHQEAVLETDNYAPLFHRDHISRLSNQGRLPVVLEMTCLTGRYIHRTSDTLDESLLRTRDVGAVAVWGPSGSGVATGHQILHRSFFQAVFDNKQTELGAAIQTSVLGLYTIGIYSDLIETYHLFGDPAMMLQYSLVDLPFFFFLPIIAPG